VTGLDRRTLLRRGAGAAAGAGLLGALPAPVRAAAAERDERRALLVVVPLVRSDHVRAFKDGSGTHTPNFSSLTGRSLRFDRAIPEVMPSLPVRRTLVTGVRSYPFRDWTLTDGLPAVPGYNPVRSVQPVLTETLRLGGVRTIYITDNPIVGGPRFPDVRRPAGTPPAVSRACCGSSCERCAGITTDVIPSIKRATKATERTFRAGIGALRELKDAPRWFLGVDPYDPMDSVQSPRIYITPHRVEEQGIGTMNGRLVELNWSDDQQDAVREAYRDHVNAVDRWLGRLMDALPDDVLVYLLGDIGFALGEHEYMGAGTPTSHRNSYEIPYLIRHPHGSRAGDSLDWYASTHDVAPTILSHLGVTIPGKMGGEDLMALFDGVDEQDLPERRFSITASGSLIVARDDRWLMVADREKQERRLYDDDQKAGDPDKKRYQNAAGDDADQLTEMSVAALTLAGGTLPEFGPTAAERPPRERGDDDVDDDGIPNDFDAVNDLHPDDDDGPKQLNWDGRDPEDRTPQHHELGTRR
jgi:hypothetical protein